VRLNCEKIPRRGEKGVTDIANFHACQKMSKSSSQLKPTEAALLAELIKAKIHRPTTNYHCRLTSSTVQQTYHDYENDTAL